MQSCCSALETHCSPVKRHFKLTKLSFPCQALLEISRSPASGVLMLWPVLADWQQECMCRAKLYTTTSKQRHKQQVLGSGLA